MTPAAAIAMLDRQIARHGQMVTLRRPVPNTTALTLDVVAFVRGYRADELVGGIQQGDTLVTISPTVFAGSAFEAAIPKAGDKIMVDSRLRQVQLVEPVKIGGQFVRFNLQVRG